MTIAAKAPSRRRWATWAAVGTGTLVLSSLSAITPAGAATTFRATGALAVGRAHAAAQLLTNGEVLVAGGQGADGSPLASAEIYNPYTGSWRSVASLPQAVTQAASVRLASGAVLVMGGWAEVGGVPAVSGAAQLYDPASGRWTSLTSLPVPTFDASAVLLTSGRVLYAGGLLGTAAASAASASCQIYDPTTGRWSSTGTLPIGVSSASASPLADGSVLLAGGFTGAGGPVSSMAEVYQPASGNWSAVSTMTNAVAGAPAVLLRNNDVLVAGGQVVAGLGTAATQLYHPSTGTWTSAGVLPRASYGAMATMTGTGQVLYAGGLASATSAPAATTALYDPSTGRWSTGPDMLTARAFGLSAALPTGDVLVAAGSTATGVTAQSELFPVGVAPVITSASSFQATAGSFNVLTITATGSPVPRISLYGTLPAGMTFYDNGNGTANITGTPPSGATGVYALTVTASNGVGSAAVQALTLRVLVPTVAPSITSAAGTTMYGGRYNSFVVTTTGWPTPGLSLYGTLPAGVSFHDNGNGTAVIAGTPPASTSGDYRVTVTASNGVGNPAVQALTLRVEPQAPSPAPSTGTGFWFADSAGRVVASETSSAIAARSPQNPHNIVQMVPTASGNGYYLVSASGGVFVYGDAGWYGSLASRHLATPTIGLAVTPSGNGYWLATRAGNVFSFGDARFHGSTASRQGVPPVVDFAASPSGKGYWLATERGNVFGFGDAAFHGSPVRDGRQVTVTDFAPAYGGGGYWLATASGKILPYGSARSYGSLDTAVVGRVVDLVPSPDAKGYWVATTQGKVFNFGNARYFAPWERAVSGPWAAFAIDF